MQEEKQVAGDEDEEDDDYEEGGEDDEEEEGNAERGAVCRPLIHYCCISHTQYPTSLLQGLTHLLLGNVRPSSRFPFSD